MARRFDRSAMDILLNGGFREAEAEVRVPAARQASFKIRSDPALLPLDMVRTDTAEYKLFAPERRPIPPQPTARQPPPPPLSERLPRWIPGKWKWPLEEALSRFLGESPEQHPWLLQVEVSWPHGQRWYYGVGLWVVCPLLAWATGMSLSLVLAGLVAGFVHGVFLRARVEKRFQWATYQVGVLMSFVMVCVVVWVSGTPASVEDWTLQAKLWKPLSGGLTFAGVPLLVYLLIYLPFFQNAKAVKYNNDVIVMGAFILTLVYASNVMMPLGLWCGALLKVVPPPPLPPSMMMMEMYPSGGVRGAAAAGQVSSMVGGGMVGTPLRQQQLQQQQQQQYQQQQMYRQDPRYGMSPAAAAAAAAVGGSPGLMMRSPQQQQQFMLAAAAQQQQWLQQQQQQQQQRLQQQPMTERDRLIATATALKEQEREMGRNHPRRWLEPEEEYGEADAYGSSSTSSRSSSSGVSPFPAGSYRRRRQAGGLGGGGGEGRGGGGVGGLAYGGSSSSSRNRLSGGGGGGGQWGGEEEVGQDEGRRYGLRSRGGRRGGGGEIEPTAMELSSSPPPPTSMDTEDFASRSIYGRRGGGGREGGRLGRFETLNPHRY